MDGVSHPNDPGARRPERGPVAELARLFLVQLAAVIGIAAAIAVVVGLVGPDHDDDVTTAGSTSTSATPETPPPSTPSQSPRPSPTSASASSSEPAPTASTTEAGGIPAPVKVDVLNQSAPGGSAAQTAQRLADAGWKIGRVDDFHGNVSTTTVYWLDPGQRRQARQISRFLGGVRVQQGFRTLVDGRVSVVLVDTT
jgi:hypothetical protein